MKMMISGSCRPLRGILFLALGLLTTGQVVAQTVWLPPQGELSVTPSYSYEPFDSAWIGADHQELPESLGGSLAQHSWSFNIEYGVSDQIALDGKIGFSRVLVSNEVAGIANDDSALSDSTVGVRWRLYDEFTSASSFIPSITLRAAAIIEGTYDENSVSSAGDGASGAEGDIYFGRAFVEQGFGIFGTFGGRVRGSGVPDELTYMAGAYQNLFEGFSLSINFARDEARSGLDIFGPGFTTDRFNEVKEINNRVGASISYTDSLGNYYSLSFAHTIGERNTPEKSVLGFSFSVPFNIS
jgi:hypothetical protein